ncbi:BglG family transcription antiterminator [Halobacillus yeomjeoni]|uniref:BglG family transcription antiterminator n=1 Tax=Halobacillus yeomjeoni TaxID=311194 RepID=UPI001CD58568|nr:BglG family transcription antiterminator [Halobacillus yeomjeoni]MCA0985152.1 BglG family transcription antiterminator [Halobacillus yeomjeoni]
MVLDKRRAHLLSFLLHSDRPLPIPEMTEKVGVSERTIYYDVDQINDWLEAENLPPVQSEYKQGLFLPEKSKAYVSKNQSIQETGWHYRFSEEERKTLIKASLLLEITPSSMERFMELTGMSRGTVAKDLKEIKGDFQAHELSLLYKRGTGYTIQGMEEIQRSIISNLLSSVLTSSHSKQVKKTIVRMIQDSVSPFHKNEEHFQEVKALLFEAEDELGLTLTDQMVEYLTLFVLILILRIKNENRIFIEQEERHVLEQSAAHPSSEMICRKLEDIYDVAFPPEEVGFITMNLLGSKVQHVDARSHTSEIKGLKKVVRRMIADFETNACVIFENKEELETNLLTHIKPAYYRLKYGVHTSNELTASIKENYPDLYLLTAKGMKHLKRFVGKEIPDDETAYLTLHFGGWLTKEKKEATISCKAIIVCENGIGTSKMLQTQLEKTVPGLYIIDSLSMREYQARDFDVDVIFSTNYLKENETPIIHVPPILSNMDKQWIKRRMDEVVPTSAAESKDSMHALMDIIQDHASIHDKEALMEELTHYLKEDTTKTKELRKPMLTDLLTEQTIQLKDREENWEKAIQTAAKPLLDNQSIGEEYVQAMIENVHELGPYIVIAPDIALPHARPEAGVNKLGMSLLQLKEPVHFSEQAKHKAHLVIVLAAIDNETHLKALAQLSEVLSEEQAIEQLKEAKDEKEILSVIEEHYVTS